jgi:hypothetical protein
MHYVERTDGRVRFAVDGEHLDGAVRVLNKFGIRSLTSQPPTLEELMLRRYGDELRGKIAGGCPDRQLRLAKASTAGVLPATMRMSPA